MEIPFEEIKRLRLQRNISQVDMADAAGMSRSAYISFEKHGSENLPLKSAVGIANKLEVPFNELFGIKGNSSVSIKQEQIIKEQNIKIKDLQNTIEKNNQFIKLLQKENRSIYKDKTALEFRHGFNNLRLAKSLIEEAKSSQELEKAKFTYKIYSKSLEFEIDQIYKSGLFSEYEILELIYENNVMLNQFDEKASDYDVQLTKYLNEFINIELEEVQQFLIKYEAKSSSG